MDLAELIRNVPDFPKPGIQFKDVTPLLQNGPAFRQIIQYLYERYAERTIDAVVAVEARGFIFAAPLACMLQAGFVPVRKPGKLPADVHRAAYELEYGTNELEIHQDALQPGARVLVLDDLLATGGTLAAACELVEKTGGVVEEVAILIELDFLQGREKLTKYPIFSMIHF
jgi:adenine phosphoribosyltransferase